MQLRDCVIQGHISEGTWALLRLVVSDKAIALPLSGGKMRAYLYHLRHVIEQRGQQRWSVIEWRNNRGQAVQGNLFQCPCHNVSQKHSE